MARLVGRVRARWPQGTIPATAPTAALPATPAWSTKRTSTSPPPGTRRSAPAVPPAASPISAGAPRQPKPQAPRRRPGPNGCRAAEGPGQPPFRLDRAARERGRRPRPPSARPPSWLLPENHHPGQDAPFPDPLTCMTRSSIRWRSCRGSERGLNDLTTPERGDTERHGCGGSVDGHAE